MSCGQELTTVVGATIEMTTSISDICQLTTTVCEAQARMIPFLFTATADGENVFTLDDTPIVNSVVVILRE